MARTESLTVRGRRTSRPAKQAIREVCLIGSRRRVGITSGWSCGDRVEWSGRSYEVTAIQPADPRADGIGRRVGYIHLAGRDSTPS